MPYLPLNVKKYGLRPIFTRYENHRKRSYLMAILSALTVYLKENTAMLIIIAAAVAFSALLFWAVSVLPLKKWALALGVKLHLVDPKKQETENPSFSQKEERSSSKESEKGDE